MKHLSIMAQDKNTSSINKLLVVGHSLSGYEKILDLLTQSGMEPARASRRERMEPAQITQILLKTISSQGADMIGQEEISPIWNELALDLMLGNIDQTMWCWADPDALSLLEYWQNIDSRLGFVLVYGSPEDFIVDRFGGVDEIGDDELSEALDEWYRYNKVLMNFFLRNSERSCLVHSVYGVENSREYIEHVAAVMMLPLSLELTESVDESANVHRGVYRYLAAEVLSRYPEMVELYEELQSVANKPYTEVSRSTQSAKETWALLVRLQSELDRLTASKKENEEALQEQQKAASLSEENELLLTQLHLVQEELERYYLENQALKKQGGIFHKPKNTRHYGAAERVREQLSYRLGAAMIANAKSPLGWISMPFALMAVRKRYREEQKAKAGKKLPKISEYADAYEAEKVKKHLSYRLGSAMIETMRSPLGIVKLPFALAKAAKSYKEERK